MNERIKELAEQAGVEIELDDYGEIRLASAYGSRLEKFTELIIRECMNICEQQRLKILNNPDDPSWTEHLAECQINMNATFLRS